MQFENDYDEFMKEKKDVREQSGYTFSPEYWEIVQKFSESQPNTQFFLHKIDPIRVLIMLSFLSWLRFYG